MASKSDFKEMLDVARNRFIDGDYSNAESMLQQIMLENNQIPEVYHMLGTIYYDRSQFSKAIKHFKKAIEIDPTYTDASIGLSIILNDLGRYDEGTKVFAEAQGVLDNNKKSEVDPFLETRLAKNHLELGDMYVQIQRFEDAIEQYHRVYGLTQAPDIQLKIIDCYAKKGDLQKATTELKAFIRDNPRDLNAQVTLGLYIYNMGNTPEAVHIWERVLFRDPDHQEAKRYLRLAQQSTNSLL